MEHARLSPSSAARWMRCPGSVALCDAVPDLGSRASDEGTLCHEALRLNLTEGLHLAFREYEVEGRPVSYTEEMEEQVELVAAWVRARPGYNGYDLECERLVSVGEAFRRGPAFSEALWGTPDVVLYGEEELLVADAKFGFEEVEADGNEQLSLYAIGVVDALERVSSRPPPRRIRLAILQPQSWPPREEVLSYGELHRRLEQYLPLVSAALAPGAPLVPGEVQCRWCRAQGVCPALQASAIELAGQEFDLAPAPEPSTEQLVRVLELAPLAEAAISAARSRALQLLQAGQEVPGWKLVESKRHRQWSDEGDAARALGMLGLPGERLYARKLISPAQAEKALRLSPRELDLLAPAPPGEPTLARESDPRPALSPAFGPGETEGHEDGE